MLGFNKPPFFKQNQFIFFFSKNYHPVLPGTGLIPVAYGEILPPKHVQPPKPHCWRHFHGHGPAAGLGQQVLGCQRWFLQLEGTKQWPWAGSFAPASQGSSSREAIKRNPPAKSAPSPVAAALFWVYLRKNSIVFHLKSVWHRLISSVTESLSFVTMKPDQSTAESHSAGAADRWGHNYILIFIFFLGSYFNATDVPLPPSPCHTRSLQDK